MSRPPPTTGGPPVSFKTVPGRHRTQKWNVARQYDYSGDDWGGYDAYDDYGDQQQQPQSGMQQGGPYSAGPGPQPGYGVLPSQQSGLGQRQRQQSFDEGDERRAFSGGTAPPPGWGDVPRGGSPAISAVSSGSGGRPSGDYARPGSGPGRMRDFTNPEQVPPPLNTRGSPAPMPAIPAAAPPAGPYPPRKQSASRGSPAPDVVPEPAITAPTIAKEKELPTPPFIRPSDIYKRMEAERERERANSMDSNSRPSLDTSNSQDPTRDASWQRPLSAVGEEEDNAPMSANVSGPMDVPHDFGEPSQFNKDVEKDGGKTHALPPIQSVSGFGSSMFGSSGTADSEQTPTSSSLQATPTATSAPSGTDHAADILAERTYETPISNIGRQPDHAADILAERTHGTPISSIGRQPDDLSHQASTSSHGFRSAVDRGFDDAQLSRDSSQSTKQSGDVSRSNTTSTSGISPIISRAPWSEQMPPPVPTIAEEPQSRASSESARNVIPRKPSPQASANASPRPSMDAGRDVAAGGITRGYRRSLDPPSSDNSPARTPAVETADGDGHSLSQGLAAQNVTTEEADAEAEQQELAKTQLEERMGRPRAGTDYLVRESDLAHAVNSSPDKEQYDPGAAKAVEQEQERFVESHPQSSAPGTGFEVPTSGRSSPTKGRVREIADQYQGLHDQSRRGSTASSKSSWSNFNGSQENLHGKFAQRSGTNDSNMVSESEHGGVEGGGLRDAPVDPSSGLAAPPPIDGRPGLPSQQSFRPQLPGGWVSYSNASGPGTPGSSLSPASAGNQQDDARASWYPGDDAGDDEPVDLTPTTRKFPLEGSHSSPSNTMLGQAKDAGTALGAALMSSVGLGHQTRDFGSSEAPPDIEVPSDRNLSGERGGLNAPERPQYYRGDTDATDVTNVTNLSAASRGSSRPPTPPAKDRPHPPMSGYDRENNYFSAAIAPLRTGRSREASPEASPAPTASTFTGYGPSSYGSGVQRDDSLRREIVRSLDSQQADVARTQDALDAPDNAARIAQGGDALPPKEMSNESPSRPQPLRMLDQRFSWETRQQQSGLLDTPQKEQDAPILIDPETGKEIGAIGGVPQVREPEPESSPEIKPEMPYERPRSRGLHIMNASDDEGDSGDEKNERSRSHDYGMYGSTAALGAGAVGMAGIAAAGASQLSSGGPVSPMTKSQENLNLRAQQLEGDGADVERTTSLRDMAPSPVSQGSGSLRLPSYYGSSGLGLDSMHSPPLPQEDYRDVDADAAMQDSAEPRSSLTVVDASVPHPPEKESSPVTATASPTSPTSKQKIPPFREILAIKNTDARIRGYDDTRRTFADMDTGLHNWLSGMLAQNPEYASLSTETYARPALQTQHTGFKGHKNSPSISKFTKSFGSGGDPFNPQRSASVNAGSSTAGTTTGGSVDMDKLQQRGKDLMKGASVLGGKAGAGAKGLLAKGKSRFGTQRESKGKVTSPTAFFMVPPASTTTDSNPYFSPAPTTSRSPPPASATTPPSDSILAATVQQNRSSSVYSNPSPPILQPVRPPDRSQTRTPASTSSNSGPLSRTLSRLRERSRSMSSSRRSRSRPQSLLLLNSNHGSELQTVEDASPRASRAADASVTGAETRGSEFGMAALSPWKEPGEAATLGAAVGNVALPERLGVLPSPGAETFSMGRESRPGTADEVGVGQRESANSAEPADLAEGSGDVTNDQSRSIGRTATEAPVLVAETAIESATRDDEDELYDTTPRQANFTSSADVDASKDVDETTPTASKHYDSVDLADRAEHTEVTGVETKEQKPDNVDTREMGVPASEFADVNITTAGPPPEDRITDVNEPVKGQSPDVLAVPGIMEPANSQEWDDRSGVSSNNDFHDTQDEPIEDDKQSSRRSSVSSIGQEALDSAQPVMSSQAVPAGPNSGQFTLQPNSGFLNAPYQHNEEGRSRSYVALGLDNSGAPLQESLDIAKKPEEESYDFIQFGASRVGGAAFQRQPAVRDASGASRPRRFSGKVRDLQPDLTQPVMPDNPTGARAPAASAISDHYGLEGVQHMSNVMDRGASPERALDKQESKKAKRKSGLFDAFKRSPSVTKTEFSGESGSTQRQSRNASSANVPVPAQGEIITRAVDSRSIEPPRNRVVDSRSIEPPRNVTKAPQRASTTAKEPDQKKKRFSGLGSIFGRSSTTGHKSEKPSRKLTKSHAPSIDNSHRQTTAPLPNSEAYERMRQQRRAEQQERQPNTYPPPSLGPPSQRYSFSDGNTFKSPEDMLPPQGGWYASRNQQLDQQAIPKGRPPFYGNLHSDNRRDSPLGQVPESSRPVERSFSRPGRPVGPPLETDSYSPPTSPVSFGAQSRQFSYPAESAYDQRSAYGPPPDRHASYRSGASEISGQSEWQRSEWRRQSSSPSISPVQTRPDNDAFPPGRGYRVGSITEEMARSPAKEYNDQQTPWAVALPRPGDPGFRRPSRAASYGTQGMQVPPEPRDYAPSGIGYAEAYPAPSRWQNTRGLPMSPESPRSSPQTQQSDSLMSHAPVFEERPQRGMMRPQGNAYPSPPMSPESQWFYNRAGLNPPSQMQYHARSDEVEGPPPPPPPPKDSYVQQRMYSYENEPPPAQSRATSGYTTRRDDPPVNEEGVEMRGVSYPGQEWMPERWD